MIESVLIVRDKGERKIYTWTFDGPKKDLKAFMDSMTTKHMKVYMQEGVDFLWSGYRGLRKRN